MVWVTESSPGLQGRMPPRVLVSGEAILQSSVFRVEGRKVFSQVTGRQVQARGKRDKSCHLCHCSAW